MRKQSLRVKLSITLVLTMFVTLSVCVFANYLFLDDFYVSRKQQVLLAGYQKINSVYRRPPVADDDKSSEIGGILSAFDSMLNGHNGTFGTFYDSDLSIEKLSQESSMGVLIYSISNERVVDGQTVYDMRMLYSSNGASSGESLDPENFSIYRDYIQSDKKEQLAGEESKYTINRVYVKRMGGDYLYLYGVLDNGDYVMLRSSVESMQEATMLSNRFFMYVVLFLSVVAFIVMLFISKLFTDRIMNLAKIAQKMSQLDFGEKYAVDTNDEIGILGYSLNTLSETLEETLIELKSANVELQRELDHKVQIDQMRKEFLSNVSHELKTPIALIQGYAEGLQENISDDPESREFYCDVIVDEAAKMNKLVKKLLDLNQIEFGHDMVNMEHFDIVSTVRNILLSADILFKQKNVTLSFAADEPLYVWSDVYLVEESFTNYMSNALNHVSGENRIEVKIKEMDGRARISVFNTGQPIPDADLDKIWVKFYKVDKARTREYGGSGVGLSIVKATMERLGQDYGVINHEDGVEFWFTLDASRGL